MYMMVGKVMFHIGFVGVDKDTNEVMTPVTEHADPTNAKRRLNDFLRPYGIKANEVTGNQLKNIPIT